MKSLLLTIIIICVAVKGFSQVDTAEMYHAFKGTKFPERDGELRINTWITERDECIKQVALALNNNHKVISIRERWNDVKDAIIYRNTPSHDHRDYRIMLNQWQAFRHTLPEYENLFEKPIPIDSNRILLKKIDENVYLLNQFAMQAGPSIAKQEERMNHMADKQHELSLAVAENHKQTKRQITLWAIIGAVGGGLIGGLLGKAL